jgi:protocatechuate 3,4-dioxygenase alpha subunit
MSTTAKRLQQTPSQTVGPYFAYGLSPEQYGYPWSSIADGDIADETVPGERIVIEGRVLDGAGEPVKDAMIEMLQPDAAGRYGAAPGANARFNGFGRCGTGTIEGGLFRFRTVKPGAPAPGEAPHIDVIVFMRGLLLHAFTRLYFDGDPANADDPVLAQVPAERRETLLARPHGPGVWRFDIRMQGEQETVFFDV